MEKENINIPKGELIEIGKLKVDEDNPNSMSEEKFNSLKKVIKKYGFIVPIITNNELMIADGFHRWKVARELGMREVPVIKLPIKEVDRRLLRQVLNKLRGRHDIDLDAAEFKRILEKTDMEEFTSLVGLGEQEVLNTLERTDREEKEAAEEVDQLGSLTITCPKCKHVFKKKKEGS